MSDKSPKITLHMVSSLDGFIAGKDGDVSWLRSTDHYEQGITLTEEAINEFVKSIDCYVMGSRTYEKALELGWPYGDTPVIVLTHRDLEDERDSVSFHSGDISALVKTLKSKHQNIWLVGGAAAAKSFIQQQLIDEIIISIMPVIVGEGTLFFDFVGRLERLHLKNVTAYKEGMVEMSYEVLKSRGKKS